MLSPLSVIELMQFSDIHRNWSVSDICRLIKPPIDRSQYITCSDNNSLKAFASIGFFSDEVSEGFRNNTHKLQANDWCSGNNVWLVDVIAPFGHARQITSGVRAALCAKGFKGHKINFRRNYGGSIRFSGVAL